MRYFLIIWALFASAVSSAQITYETVRVDYDSVWEYKNLRVYPVRGMGGGGGFPEGVVSLQEAIKTGLATVSERGTASTTDVHWVKIKNNSNKAIYVGSGEMLIGGRQDRILVKDTLLVPNGEEQLIPAMCIEQGRWSKKERKFIYGGYASPRLRAVLNKSGNQSLLWQEIYSQLKSEEIQSPTLAYIAGKQSEAFIAESNEYLNFFREKLKNDSNVVGMVCITGNNISGTDIYINPPLFRSQVMELLAGYVEDAIKKGSAPVMKLDEVIDYMDRLLTNEYSQEIFCRKNGMIHRIGGRVVHVTGYDNREN